jgi:hypothetical protein
MTTDGCGPLLIENTAGSDNAMAQRLEASRDQDTIGQAKGTVGFV